MEEPTGDFTGTLSGSDWSAYKLNVEAKILRPIPEVQYFGQTSRLAVS